MYEVATTTLTDSPQYKYIGMMELGENDTAKIVKNIKMLYKIFTKYEKVNGIEK